MPLLCVDLPASPGKNRKAPRQVAAKASAVPVFRFTIISVARADAYR
jgi:hypothetical protein